MYVFYVFVFCSIMLRPVFGDDDDADPASVCDEVTRTCLITDAACNAVTVANDSCIPNYTANGNSCRAAANDSCAASLFSSILQQSIFGDGWTLLFAVWSSAAVNVSNRSATYILPPALITFNNIILASDTPGVPVHIRVDHTFFRSRQDIGKCSFLRFTGSNVTIRDMAVSISQTCVDTISRVDDPFYNGAAFGFDGSGVAMQNVIVSGATWAFQVDAITTVGVFSALNVSLFNSSANALITVMPCWLGHIGTTGGSISITSTSVDCVLTIDSRFSEVDTTGVDVPYYEMIGGIFPAAEVPSPRSAIDEKEETGQVFGPIELILAGMAGIFVLALVIHGLRVKHYTGDNGLCSTIPPSDMFADNLQSTLTSFKDWALYTAPESTPNQQFQELANKITKTE